MFFLSTSGETSKDNFGFPNHVHCSNFINFSEQPSNPVTLVIVPKFVQVHIIACWKEEIWYLNVDINAHI